MAQFPSSTSAYGIWSLSDQRDAVRGDNWPKPSLITSGLVSYLDARNVESYSGSGTTWTDLSGNSINGTLSNDVSYSNGALVFSTGIPVVSLPANSIDTNSDFTQTFVNIPTVSARLALTLSSGSNSGSLQVRYRSGQIQLVRSREADMGTFSGFTGNDDQFYNITLTRSGNVYSLYVDGVFINTITRSDTFDISAPLIGDNNYLSGSEAFYGNMYACVYYDRALTSSEIYNNYLVLSKVNGFPIPNNSLLFDGSGDYLASASTSDIAFGTGDWTIECWVYPTASPSNMRLWNFSGAQDNGDLNVGSTGTLNYYNGSVSTTSTGGLVPVNQWTHIAIVRSSGTVKGYVNGVEALSQSTTPNTTSAREIYIGGNVNQLFTGYMSNFRIVKGTAVYTSNFTVPTENLTAIAGTVLLTCQENNILTDGSSTSTALTVNGNLTASTETPF